MRELVYLSEAKLAQFLPGPRRFPFSLKAVNTPVGGAEVERNLVPGNAERLHQVEEHIARQARWYTEDGLRPGQWVQFEAPMDHRVLSDPGADLSHQPEMVVFVDAASAESIRLLLHGSAAHLVGSKRPAQQWLTSDLLGFHELAVRMARQEAAGEAEETDARADAARSGGFEFGTSRLIAKFDRPTGLETAIWMRGYARTTVVTEYEGIRYVVASPLYVEYTDPPEDAT